jgi:hypothetical protein
MSHENGFELIYDQDEFVRVFHFIRDGFGWTEVFAEKMYNQVLNSQINTPLAAVNRLDGQVNVAILIIFQGILAEGQRGVLNLSSWYAAPEIRGVAVVNFAKKLLTNLQGYIITNYTPNEAAGRVFNSIGFKSMDVSMIRGGVLKKSPFWNLQAFRVLKGGKGVTVVPLEPSSSLSGESWNARYRLYPRNIMGINFNILNVYQTDIINWPPSIWHVLRLMFSNRAPMLILYFFDAAASKDMAKWLIYDPDGIVAYIPPLGSELNVIS